MGPQSFLLGDVGSLTNPISLLLLAPTCGLSIREGVGSLVVLIRERFGPLYINPFVSVLRMLQREVCARLNVGGYATSIEEQILLQNVKPFREGLVCKAHRLLYHSSLGLRIIKERNRICDHPLPSEEGDLKTFQ